jgi:hypothetical protein
MSMQRRELDFNKVYTSNTSGNFILVEEYEPKKTRGTSSIRQIKVRFLETGYEIISDPASINSGAIKDPYYKRFAGIGYFGEPKVPYTNKEYDIWYTMINKCYNPEYNKYPQYGALGVTVDPRWHCFANFIEDLPYIDGYDDYIKSNEKFKFHLDKDIKQQHLPINKRVYSKDTCTFIRGDINSRYTERRKSSSKVKDQSSYKGVYKTSNGKFQCSINVNRMKFFLGVFDDEIAAANMYNHIYAIAIGVPNSIRNNVPYMSPIEALSHRTSNTPLELPKYMLDALGITKKDLENYSATNVTSNYVGVYASQHNPNIFVSRYNIDGTNYITGRFDNEIAAATMHDYVVRYKCGGKGKYNNTGMGLYEALSYARNLNTMCTLVDKN